MKYPETLPYFYLSESVVQRAFDMGAELLLLPHRAEERHDDERTLLECQAFPSPNRPPLRMQKCVSVYKNSLKSP